MRLSRSNALLAYVARILGRSFLLMSVAAPGQVISLGSVVSHPENITGVWEMSLPSHGVLGLSIALNATIPGTAKTFTGAEQKIKLIRIVTYLRRGDHSDNTDWETSSPGNLSWKDNHLYLHTIGSRNGPEQVDLDLAFDPAQSRWSGSFKSPSFSGKVALQRPLKGEATAPIGTWISASTDSPDQSRCIHIGLGIDGRMVFWEDFLTLNGLSRYTNHLHAPERTDEGYGELLDDQLAQHLDSSWHFRVGDQESGETITGEVSKDGSTFSGKSKFEGNNGIQNPSAPPLPFTWHRAEGNSCAAPLERTSE